MMQKLEQRAVGLKPSKIGHVDSVEITSFSLKLGLLE